MRHYTVNIFLFPDGSLGKGGWRNSYANPNSSLNYYSPKQQKDVVAFRILVYSGTGGGQGLASCAEMEFYRDASYDKDYLKLFTDASCSQLRKTLKMGMADTYKTDCQ